MSLEKLRKDWDAIGEVGLPNQLSNEEIRAILTSKYRVFATKSLILELFILLVYVYFIGLTIFRFDELKIPYLEILAITSTTMLVSLFIMRSLKIISIFRNRYLNKPHAVVLKKLALQKIRIQRFHLANIVMGFMLVVSLIILNIKIYNEYDLVQHRSFWLIIIPSSFIFIVFVNRWIKKHYLGAIREAEALLNDLT